MKLKVGIKRRRLVNTFSATESISSQIFCALANIISLYVVPCSCGYLKPAFYGGTKSSLVLNIFNYACSDRSTSLGSIYIGEGEVAREVDKSAQAFRSYSGLCFGEFLVASHGFFNHSDCFCTILPALNLHPTAWLEPLVSGEKFLDFC